MTVTKSLSTLFFNAKKKNQILGRRILTSLAALPAPAPTCWRTSGFLSPRNNTSCFLKQITYIVYIRKLVNTNTFSVLKRTTFNPQEINPKFGTQAQRERDHLGGISWVMEPQKVSALPRVFWLIKKSSIIPGNRILEQEGTWRWHNSTGAADSYHQRPVLNCT